MKTKRKKIVAAAVIAVTFAILFTPFKTRYKDGGSVSWKSLVYEVIKYHQIGDAEGTVIEGWGVRIFGFDVYENKQTVYIIE